MINVCQEYTSRCFSWSRQVTMCGITWNNNGKSTRSVQSHIFVCSFRRILEAATILSASFNLSRDSLSGRWCVWWSEFRNARHQPSCANAKPEKKKGAIMQLHEVYPREAFHPNFSFFWKVHSCMLGATAICTNFLRNYLFARSRYLWSRCLDLEIIIVKFRRIILQQRRVKLASCETIKVRVTVDSHGEL